MLLYLLNDALGPKAIVFVSFQIIIFYFMFSYFDHHLSFARKMSEQVVVEVVAKCLSFDNAAIIARKSFNLGRTMEVSFREKQLTNLFRMYQDKEYKMLQALKADLGKNAFEASLFEIEFLKNDVLNVLSKFKKWLKPKNTYKRLMDFFGTPQIYRDPYGVVFIVGAWNYPFRSTLKPLASAIAAGNCVVIQPPEMATHTTKFLIEQLNNYLDGSCYLVSDGSIRKQPDIDYLFYTGTLNKAKTLQAICATAFIPGTFVVGSQNPVYIDESADIYLTVQRVMWGKCVNAGQTCIAPGYILCTQEVMKSFIREVPGVISAFYGDPQQSPDYARIISKGQFDQLVSYLNGKEIAYGGHHDRETLYFEPTILANVTPNFSLMYEETYGPILPIVVIQNPDEVVSFLRAREKPLAFYIFARNQQVVEHLITRTSSGGVAVNDVLIHVAPASLPFGGVGASGFGSYHGKKTFDAFTHEKSVLKKPLNSLVERIENIRYPPYNDRNLFILKHLMRKREFLFTHWMKLVLTFIFGMLFSCTAIILFSYV